jgi:hypothetical protein
MKRICLILALLTSACTSWRDIPDDVTFVAFHYGTGPYKTNRRGEAIDVEMATNFNYMNYNHGGAMSVNAIFYFCDQQNMRVQGLGGLRIFKYMNNHWVSVGMPEPDNSPPPYHYHTAIHAAIHDAEPDIKSEPTILDYDLRETPHDLCFYLDAGSMWYHEKSIVVRIPKETLIRFLAEHPRPQIGEQ